MSTRRAQAKNARNRFEELFDENVPDPTAPASDNAVQDTPLLKDSNNVASDESRFLHRQIEELTKRVKQLEETNTRFRESISNKDVLLEELTNEKDSLIKELSKLKQELLRAKNNAPTLLKLNHDELAELASSEVEEFLNSLPSEIDRLTVNNVLVACKSYFLNVKSESMKYGRLYEGDQQNTAFLLFQVLNEWSKLRYPNFYASLTTPNSDNLKKGVLGESHRRILLEELHRLFLLQKQLDNN